MTESFGALCSDFYVNQKLNVKLDLPTGRETVLDLFERVRRQYPRMEVFKRYKDELALETKQGDMPQQWLAIRSASIRSGTVNPDSFGDAYAPHRHVLEVAPFYLSVSPLDIDFLELLYGFDLMAAGNHDQIVHRALFEQTAMAGLMELDDATPIECQPIFGVAFGEGRRCEAHIEVKTRSADTGDNGFSAEPISIYLTIRSYGPMTELGELGTTLTGLAARGEELIESSVLPGFIVPIRNAIVTGGG